MSKILIDRAVVEQALDFCEFAWRDVLMNEYAFKRLEQMIATLRASLAEPAEQEAVAAQHRFRRPEKGTPDWSVWQPCKINNKRPAHEIDSQGYQVQYRALYTAPQPVKREPSAGGVLFAVEQAIQNDDCPWQIEQAFDAYEAERKNGITKE